jgi:hypothetical protein
MAAVVAGTVVIAAEVAAGAVVAGAAVVAPAAEVAGAGTGVGVLSPQAASSRASNKAVTNPNGKKQRFRVGFNKLSFLLWFEKRFLVTNFFETLRAVAIAVCSGRKDAWHIKTWHGFTVKVID